MRRMGMLMAMALLAAGLCGCPKKPPAPPPAPKHPPDKQWTSEEMAKDPEGYLRWADEKVQAQTAASESRLKTIEGRLTQIKAKAAELTGKMSDAQNIHDRMEQAIQRSDDEDRLPVQMGGRSFTREEAQQVVTQSLKWIEDRKSLAVAYEQAVGKLSSAAGELRGQIDAMGRTRERLALDLEKVRLNQGVAETERLAQTQAEIGGFSKVLSGSEETIGLSNLPSSDKETAKVDIDSFLKK